jgi:uncharacterized membrane protein YsdA (DUF1294 family)
MLARALVAYAALSLVTFLVYGWDKRQARQGGRRVPEVRLHALALAGGFVGAWLGMRAFRHKTRKIAFTVVMILAAAVHVGSWWWWAARA